MNRGTLLSTATVIGMMSFGAQAQYAHTVYGGGSSLGLNEEIRTVDAAGPTTGAYVNVAPVTITGGGVDNGAGTISSGVYTTTTQSGPILTVPNGGANGLINIGNIISAGGIAPSTSVVGAGVSCQGGLATCYPLSQSALTSGTIVIAPATGQSYEVLYNPDGSGAGQQAFIAQDVTVHAGQSTAPAVHFGASDAYLTAAQIGCWRNGSDTTDCATAGYTTGKAAVAGGAMTKGGPIIQIPAFGTPIAIAQTAYYASVLKMNDSDLCGVFSGKLTDWSQTSAYNAKKSPVSGPITVVYRSDGSGTSFLFTQHLAAVCTTANTASGVTFVPTKAFASVFPGGTVPANFVGVSGSSGVANQMVGTNAGITYLTPDYTNVAPTSVPNSTGPINAWAANKGSPYLALQAVKLQNAAGRYYMPMVASASSALKTAAATSGNPTAIITAPTNKSQASDPTNWIPTVANPSAGYPIVGYTTLEFAQCYSDPAVGAIIVAWINQLYNAANKPNLSLEGFTAAPAGFGAAIKKTFASNNFGFNLNINNPGICNTTGRAGTYPGL